MVHALRSVLLLLALAVPWLHANAQAYPARPINFVVGNAAGGGTDISARIIGTALAKRIGRSVVIENRVGAGGLIAANGVMNAEPDGYTAWYAEAASIHPRLTKNGIVAPATLTPVTILQAGGFLVVARPDLPVQSFRDLVAYAKANPGKLNFASVGNTTDLMVEVLKARTGIDALTVRYKGDAPAITALLGKEVDFAALNVTGVLSYAQAGRLKPLFTTMRHRVSLLPDVPTAQEAGIPDYVVEFNLGLWVPKNTPRDVVAKLATEASAAVKSPEVAEQFRKLGAEPVGSTPEQAEQIYEGMVRFWSEAARIARFEPQ